MKYLFAVICINLVINLYAQPCTKIDELNRKRHKMDGMTYGHPYTTFDRHNGKSFSETIDSIRAKIKSEKDLDNKPVYSAYKLVYEHAILARPSDNGMNKTAVSDLAAWAKNNAFVFLIGLDADGNFMDTTKYNGQTVASLSKRNEFKDRAYNSFDYLTGEIDANNPGWGWWVVSPSACFGANLIEEEKFLTKLKIHCCATQFYSVV